MAKSAAVFVVAFVPWAVFHTITSVSAATIGDSETQFTREYGVAVERRELGAGVSAETYQFQKDGGEFRIYAVFLDGVCHIMGIEAAHGKPLNDATIRSWLDANAAKPKDAGHAWKQMPPKRSEPHGTRIWVRRDSRYEVLSATYKKNSKGFWNFTFESGKGMDWSSRR
jgi:hypothetical protein